MGEQRAAARYFPLHRAAQRFQIDRSNMQIALSGEMLVDRLGQLLRGREVDIAVRQVDRRAGEAGVALEHRHLLAGQHLVRRGRPLAHASPSGEGMSDAGAATSVASTVSISASSSASIRAAETTCSLSATSNNLTPAEPRPMTRSEVSGMRIILAWSVTSIS